MLIKQLPRCSIFGPPYSSRFSLSWRTFFGAAGFSPAVLPRAVDFSARSIVASFQCASVVLLQNSLIA